MGHLHSLRVFPHTLCFNYKRKICDFIQEKPGRHHLHSKGSSFSVADKDKATRGHVKLRQTSKGVTPMRSSNDTAGSVNEAIKPEDPFHWDHGWYSISAQAS